VGWLLRWVRAVSLARELLSELVEVLEKDPETAARIRVALAVIPTAQSSEDDLLSKDETARVLKCHPCTLDRAVRAGCPHEVFNGRKRFRVGAVRSWFSTHKLTRKATTDADNDPIDVEDVVRGLGMRRRRKAS
jgi:hypothetical protein